MRKLSGRQSASFTALERPEHRRCGAASADQSALNRRGVPVVTAHPGPRGGADGPANDQRRKLRRKRIRNDMTYHRLPVSGVGAEDGGRMSAHLRRRRLGMISPDQRGRLDQVTSGWRIAWCGGADHRGVDHWSLSAGAAVHPQHRWPGRWVVGRPPVGDHTARRRRFVADQLRRRSRIGGDDHVPGLQHSAVLGRHAPASARVGHVGHSSTRRHPVRQRRRQLSWQRLHALGGQCGHPDREHAHQQQRERVGRALAVIEQHPGEKPVDDPAEFPRTPDRSSAAPSVTSQFCMESLCVVNCDGRRAGPAQRASAARPAGLMTPPASMPGTLAGCRSGWATTVEPRSRRTQTPAPNDCSCKA